MIEPGVHKNSLCDKCLCRYVCILKCDVERFSNSIVKMIKDEQEYSSILRTLDVDIRLNCSYFEKEKEENV
jgi:hypothetical protein